MPSGGHDPAMIDDQAMREHWDKLLAAHRALVWAYVQALGTETAPLIAPQVRATTINVRALSELLGLPVEDDPSAELDVK